MACSRRGPCRLALTARGERFPWPVLRTPALPLPREVIAKQFVDGKESLSYGGPQERGWVLFQDVVRGENQ